MKLKNIMLLIVMLSVFVSSAQFVNDTWTGRDKVAHLTYCTFISTSTGAVAKDILGFKYGYELGIATAIGVGIWKETRDGIPSYKDLTFDVAGAFVGYALNKVYQEKYGNSFTLQRKLEKEERKLKRKLKRIHN